MTVVLKTSNDTTVFHPITSKLSETLVIQPKLSELSRNNARHFNNIKADIAQCVKRNHHYSHVKFFTQGYYCKLASANFNFHQEKHSLKYFFTKNTNMSVI